MYLCIYSMGNKCLTMDMGIILCFVVLIIIVTKPLERLSEYLFIRDLKKRGKIMAKKKIESTRI